MANQLKMAVVNAIITLKQRGWSIRRIARELEIDRATVRRHLELAQNGSNPVSDLPIGTDNSKPATNAPPGSVADEAGKDQDQSGKLSGPGSQCEPYAAVRDQIHDDDFKSTAGGLGQADRRCPVRHRNPGPVPAPR